MRRSGALQRCVALCGTVARRSILAWFHAFFVILTDSGRSGVLCGPVKSRLQLRHFLSPNKMYVTQWYGAAAALSPTRTHGRLPVCGCRVRR